MVTYNDKILVPNTAKDGLDTIHPETNTSNVYDFKSGKWLDDLLDNLNPKIPDATTTQKGIVQLNDTITSTSTTEGATANTVKQVNDLKANKEVDGPYEIILEPNYAYSPATVIYPSLKYYKDSFGFVFISGVVLKKQGAGYKVSTLPVGYRPKQRINSLVQYSVGSTNTNLIVTLDVNGEINFTPTTTTTDITLLVNESYYAGN